MVKLLLWVACGKRKGDKKGKGHTSAEVGPVRPSSDCPTAGQSWSGPSHCKRPTWLQCSVSSGDSKRRTFPPGLTALNLKFGFYCKECSSFPTAYGNTAHIKASSYTLGPLCELEPQKSIWSGKTVRCGWRTTGFRGEEAILPIRGKGNLNTEQKKSTIKNSTLLTRWCSQHNHAYGTITTSRHSFLWQLQRQSDPFFGSHRDIYWAPTTTYSSRCWGVSF